MMVKEALTIARMRKKTTEIRLMMMHMKVPMKLKLNLVSVMSLPKFKALENMPTMMLLRVLVYAVPPTIATVEPAVVQQSIAMSFIFSRSVLLPSVHMFCSCS